MAFSPFNLLGTTVVSDPTRGPLGPLYSNQQSTNLLKYPLDLGDKADRGHYIVFYIKKQQNGVNNKNLEDRHPQLVVAVVTSSAYNLK